MWKRVLFTYLAVALIAFVLWMIPVAKQFGKRGFWQQTYSVAKSSALWPYVAFRHVVKY